MQARYLELEILLSQVGQEEGPANNTGTRVSEYLSAANINDAEPWCVAFGGQWAHRLATGGKRTLKAGRIVITGGESIANGTASCSTFEAYARSQGWIVKRPLKADKAIIEPGEHFTTIVKVTRILPGWVYCRTVEGNTSAYDALSTTPHGRDGVYLKRRVFRTSGVTFIREEGPKAKAVDPLALTALARLQPKKPKPEPIVWQVVTTGSTKPAFSGTRKQVLSWLESRAPWVKHLPNGFTVTRAK